MFVVGVDHSFKRSSIFVPRYRGRRNARCRAVETNGSVDDHFRPLKNISAGNIWRNEHFQVEIDRRFPGDIGGYAAILGRVSDQRPGDDELSASIDDGSVGTCDWLSVLQPSQSRRWISRGGTINCDIVFDDDLRRRRQTKDFNGRRHQNRQIKVFLDLSCHVRHDASVSSGVRHFRLENLHLLTGFDDFDSWFFSGEQLT